MALVAVAAAALSFVSLWRLGQLAGYGALSALYPVVLDLGAASSCAAWLHTRSRQASAMTWALLGLSVVLNGTVHWLESTGQLPGWPLVVGVAAIPPLTLGLVVHLVISMDREPAAVEPAASQPERPAVSPVAVPERPAAPSPVVPASPRAKPNPGPLVAPVAVAEPKAPKAEQGDDLAALRKEKDRLRKAAARAKAKEEREQASG
jgi:hypothetical protein